MTTAKGKTPKDVVKAPKAHEPAAAPKPAEAPPSQPADDAPKPDEHAKSADAPEPANDEATGPGLAAALFVPAPERLDALKAGVEAFAASRQIGPEEASLLVMEAGLEMLKKPAYVLNADGYVALAEAPAEGMTRVVVTGPSKGRLRLGRRFGPEQSLPFDVNADELAALESDPRLKVARQ